MTARPFRVPGCSRRGGRHRQAPRADGSISWASLEGEFRSGARTSTRHQDLMQPIDPNGSRRCTTPR
jgi:hypothetical protein